MDLKIFKISNLEFMEYAAIKDCGLSGKEKNQESQTFNNGHHPSQNLVFTTQHLRCTKSILRSKLK